MFLLLGTIYAIMGIIAVILISEPEESSVEEDCKDENLDKEHIVEPKKNISINLSPLEVLKTRWFYQVCVISWENFKNVSMWILTWCTMSSNLFS